MLTKQFIQTAICPDGLRRIEYFDTVAKNFSLEVRPSGGKTFYRRIRDRRGSVRQIRLGDERDLPLADARKLADEVGRRVAMGEDPIAEKRIARSVPTFAAFVEQQYLPFAKNYKRS